MKLQLILEAIKGMSLDDKLTLYKRLRCDPRVRAFSQTDAQYQKCRERAVVQRAKEADHLNRWRRRQRALGND